MSTHASFSLSGSLLPQQKSLRIQLRSVSKSYAAPSVGFADGFGWMGRLGLRKPQPSSGVKAIESVDLQVQAGQTLVLIGPSGCGKTTLLNLIAGFEPADPSSLVMVDGHPVTGPGPQRMVMFQDHALFPWLTVRQNVEFPLHQQGNRTAGQCRLIAERYLAMVGLKERAQARVHELSGGMKQRVALARALAPEPSVLLMDEPFAAVDAMTRERLYVELQTIIQQIQCSVVWVTHNVREAVCLGDRVLVMSHSPGRIVGEFPVHLPRPRQMTDPAIGALAKPIAQCLRETMVREDELA